jgi:type I restriction enzyme M protein
MALACPAAFLILRKNRPKERRGKVLLVYAARHYRELSAKNELRPQDVMRILVHVQAYGDAALVPGLVESHKARLIAQIDEEERQEIERLNAFYEPFQQKLDESFFKGLETTDCALEPDAEAQPGPEDALVEVA